MKSKGGFSGDSVPRPLGSIALMASLRNQLPLGLSSPLPPSLVFAPESVLSCFPAEAYPPLRPFVVYPLGRSELYKASRRAIDVGLSARSHIGPWPPG